MFAFRLAVLAMPYLTVQVQTQGGVPTRWHAPWNSVIR